MNSGCSIVASCAIGSVPFLLKNGYNGIIYNNEDNNDLCDKVEHLILDRKMQNRLGKNAYNTIINTWNAKNAVDKFLKLVYKIENNMTDYEKDGPCSGALPISNKKMYNHLIRSIDDEEANQKTD
jgi:hypothetical protein